MSKNTMAVACVCFVLVSAMRTVLLRRTVMSIQMCLRLAWAYACALSVVFSSELVSCVRCCCGCLPPCMRAR